MYYKPLCYQLFPETENQRNWNNIIESPLWNLLTKITIIILKSIKLDKQIEPGTSFFYLLSKVFMYINLYFTIKLIYYFIK